MTKTSKTNQTDTSSSSNKPDVPIPQTDEEIRNPGKGEMRTVQAAYRLNRKNYLKWFQAVQTFLKRKGKPSHF